MNDAVVRSSGSGIGLILPGGGVRGAYQAGSVLYVAEYLAREGLRVDAIAGASVGALNGAILAGGGSLLDGARTLHRLWRAVGELPPAELAIFRRLPGMELGVLMSLLSAAGEAAPFEHLLREIGEHLKRRTSIHPQGWVVEAASALLSFGPELRSNPSLQSMLRDAISVKALRSGVPLYVSVYPSEGALMDTARFALSTISDIDTGKSKLLHIQSLPDDQQHEGILASAAIPFLFEARVVLGQSFSDGALGGWRKQQGQVPALELCEQCPLSQLMVLHCSDGNLWNRRDGSLPQVIEVRPTQVLGTGRTVADFIDADSETIENHLERGYRDAEAIFRPLIRVAKGHREAAAARLTRDQSLEGLDD
jgi:NTE family protein